MRGDHWIFVYVIAQAQKMIATFQLGLAIPIGAIGPVARASVTKNENARLTSVMNTTLLIYALGLKTSKLRNLTALLA